MCGWLSTWLLPGVTLQRSERNTLSPEQPRNFMQTHLSNLILFCENPSALQVLVRLWHSRQILTVTSLQKCLRSMAISRQKISRAVHRIRTHAWHGYRFLHVGQNLCLAETPGSWQARQPTLSIAAMAVLRLHRLRHIKCKNQASAACQPRVCCGDSVTVEQRCQVQL